MARLSGKFRRILALCMTTVLTFGLASCAGSGSESSVPSDNSQSPNASSQPDSSGDPNSSLVTGRFTFTEEEIKAQEKAGEKIQKELREAAKDLSVSEYTIPPGDYGFDLNNNIGGVNSGFVLYGVERPDDNPFTINAQGVTFWFHTTGEPSGSVGKGINLVNCSNIRIVGMTTDSYEKNTIEGKLVRVDKEKNQLEIDLYPHTMTSPDTIYRIGSDTRVVPVKADGTHIASLYNLNNTWGPEYMFISKLERGENDNRLLITLRSRGLIDTMESSGWKEAYGTEGTLEIGDSISVIYGVVLAVSLDNCKQITIEDLDCFMTRGGFWENGGYGNHKWINCRFIARPGTDAVMGGDGNMSQGLRVGSTYDGLEIGVTSDDAFNIHGFWSKAIEVNGNTLTIDKAPSGLMEGDTVEFYSDSGKLMATCTLAKTPDANMTWSGEMEKFHAEISGTLPDNPLACTIRWPNSECDGWAIRNCTFNGTYQRILIQSGPGVFENNIVKNMGSNLALTTSTADTEAGFLEDIVVRNNVFYNSCVHPGGYPIQIFFNQNWKPNQTAARITIQENVFVGAGNAFVSSDNLDGLELLDNVLINPLRYTALATPSMRRAASCMVTQDTKNIVVRGNYLFQQTDYTDPDLEYAFVDKPAFAQQTGNVSHIDPENRMQNAVKEALAKGDAKSIYETILQAAKDFG